MSLIEILGGNEQRLEAGPFEPYTRPNGKPVTLSARRSEPGAMLASGEAIDSSELDRFIKLWKSTDVSWRNDLPEYAGPLPDSYTLGVLETRDLAARPLKAVLSMLLEHMEAAKVGQAGGQEGKVLLVDAELHERVSDYLSHADKRGYCLIERHCHIHRLLVQAERLFVIDSPVGLDALIRGVEVTILGRPFYRGKSLYEAITEYVYTQSDYWHPEKAVLTSPCELVEWLALQRQHRYRFTGDVHALGFSRWKYRILEDYFQGATVVWQGKNRLNRIDPSAQRVVWGHRGQEIEHVTGPVIRVEDAFIRSVGLGAQLIRPVSWVLDDVGLYYDPSKPSRLELILAREQFSEELLERSRKLRKRLIEERITKYNVGQQGWRPKTASEARILLVVGQVEDDASIRLGTQNISRNIDLLRTVRESNPDAYVIYKPHPDVMSKLRKAGEGESEAERFCDELVIDGSIAELLEIVEEVHVMTSLAGFEALLRGKKVVTYGQPFYSGWGLTHDKAPLERRQRRLSLDELVAGALFLYPTYVSLKTGFYMTPEDALDQLIEWRDRKTYDPTLLEKGMVRLRRYAYPFRKILNKVI